MTSSSKAIVISSESFGEADQYIQFYTLKWGMITALAKSAKKSKKRYIGGLDLFCHDEIIIRGETKERPYLIELTVLNSFPSIRDNLDRMLTAGKITQWVKKLANQSTPAPFVYSLLGQTLALIEKENELSRLELIAVVFKLKLISLLGLKPISESCARCQNTHAAFYFDMEMGGIVCEGCIQNNAQGAVALSSNELLVLSSADKIKLTQLHQLTFSDDVLLSISRLITRFTSYHMHTKLPV